MKRTVLKNPSKWEFLQDPPLSFSLQFPELPPLVVRLLYHRGLRTQGAIDVFLSPDYSRDAHDPFLFRDMRKAVDRIFDAIEAGERIVIHGDYDADGVSGSAILLLTLKGLGSTSIHVHLPHREREGYGMHPESVLEFARAGTKLVITCDCGTANVAEVDLANARGMDVIITDHHEELPHLPKPFAFLNPKLSDETYPFKQLAGGGVAFKLATALSVASRADAKKRSKVSSLPEGFEKWLLDLAAISTVTDMVPLHGENRVLVKFGLLVLKKTRRIGLAKLTEVAGLRPERIDADAIGYSLGPRINAAGRMDHANAALALLTTEDEREADRLSAELQSRNVERQKLTEEIVREVKTQVGPAPAAAAIVAIGEAWPVGVLGLIAGRIADFYGRPAFVGTRRGEEIVASGRSVEAFDITAALTKLSRLFRQYGGHRQACGFVMPRSSETAFRQEVDALALAAIGESDTGGRIAIDATASLLDFTWELAEILSQFEPFGEGNPRPRFLVKELSIDGVERVGGNGQHLRLRVRDPHTAAAKRIIAFNHAGRWADALTPGAIVDTVVESSVNEWNGNRDLQLKLVDLRLLQTKPT